MGHCLKLASYSWKWVQEVLRTVCSTSDLTFATVTKPVRCGVEELTCIGAGLWSSLSTCSQLLCRHIHFSKLYPFLRPVPRSAAATRLTMVVTWARSHLDDIMGTLCYSHVPTQLQMGHNAAMLRISWPGRSYAAPAPGMSILLHPARTPPSNCTPLKLRLTMVLCIRQVENQDFLSVQ